MNRRSWLKSVLGVGAVVAAPGRLRGEAAAAPTKYDDVVIVFNQSRTKFDHMVANEPMLPLGPSVKVMGIVGAKSDESNRDGDVLDKFDALPFVGFCSHWTCYPRPYSYPCHPPLPQRLIDDINAHGYPAVRERVREFIWVNRLSESTRWWKQHCPKQYRNTFERFGVPRSLW